MLVIQLEFAKKIGNLPTRAFTMRIPAPIETQGYFWLAGRQDNKVMGILHIDELGESFLELLGSLQNDPLEPRKLHILGSIEQGRPVTLTDCIPTNTQSVWNSQVGELTKSRIHVGTAFVGSHFEKEIRFTDLDFSVEGLQEWFFWSGSPISTTYEDLWNYSISYQRPEPIEIHLDDDLKATFLMNATHSSEMFSTSVRIQPSILLESSHPQSFEDLIKIASRLKNFLSLAVDQPVTFTSLTGFTDASPELAPVRVYGKFDPYSLEKPRIDVGNLLFSFRDVAHNIEALLQNWLRSYDKFEPTFNLYFTVFPNRYMHLEARFLFLVHGLESLHRGSSEDTRIPQGEFEDLVEGILDRVPKDYKGWIHDKLRHANELSLRKRLRLMISPFSELYGTKREREALISKVVSTRNYYTHYDKDDESEAATDFRELALLYRTVDNLLKLHLLGLSGLEDSRIVKAVALKESQRKALKGPFDE